MASLKEIKGRIGSVRSTLKITSAMKIVASTKLHHAQVAIENMLPYDRRLSGILQNFLDSGVKVDSPYVEERKVERVTIVPIASNSSLCGGYNNNVIRKTLEVLGEYAHLPKEQVTLFPVGRKVVQGLGKHHPLDETFKLIGDKPAYKEIAAMADKLLQRYVERQTDRVELIYMHYKSTATQVITRETYLPLRLTAAEEGQTTATTDYITEPSADYLVSHLHPQALKMKPITVLLHADAAEHAARTVALQQATDNAEELLQELSLMYNKGRQQAITAELLDIIGGTMA